MTLTRISLLLGRAADDHDAGEKAPRLPQTPQGVGILDHEVELSGETVERGRGDGMKRSGVAGLRDRHDKRPRALLPVRRERGLLEADLARKPLRRIGLSGVPRLLVSTMSRLFSSRRPGSSVTTRRRSSGSKASSRFVSRSCAVSCASRSLP